MNIVILVDFNNAGPDGLLRLNCEGTIADLARHGIVLDDGLRLTVSDGDLMAEVVVRSPSSEERVWRAQVLGPVTDRRA
jgi:hypothetical protein